jgi:tRNA (guanine37-N1)-methyltransferase
VRCDIVTIFPEFFDSPLSTGLLGKAVERGLLDVRRHDLREWTHDRHRTVDDTPFGGGAGMVMRPEPWFEALDDLLEEGPARVVLLAPDGRRFDQETASRLALEPRLVLCCGRYEGIDERVRGRVDEVLSIGDFVLAGGETAALVVLDALARLLPGVMGNASSATDESFAAGLLEYPQYTRPAVYRDLEVPEVLRSGNHGAIARWRRDQAIQRTRQVRPDLLDAAELTEDERARHGLGEQVERPPRPSPGAGWSRG